MLLLTIVRPCCCWVTAIIQGEGKIPLTISGVSDDGSHHHSHATPRLRGGTSMLGERGMMVTMGHGTNIFKGGSRHSFFQLITKSFPEILPITTLFYDQASTVHHKWADGTWRILLMEECVTQGCPLSPIFASLVVAKLLEPVDHLLKQRATEQFLSGNQGNDGNRGVTHFLSYVHNVSACTPLDDLQFQCEQFDQQGSPLGCFINQMKTRILTSTSGTSPLTAIHLTNPTLATSIKHTISTYSTKLNNTTSTGPPLPVELTRGCHLLGSQIGSASFAK